MFAGKEKISDERTGVSRQQRDCDFAHAAFTNLDHFADVSKMILNTLPAVETRHPGLLDYGLEVAVLRVLKNLGQVAALPILIACFIDLTDPLESQRMTVTRSGTAAPGVALRLTEREDLSQK